MKWYSYLICFVLIIAGLFSTIELVKIFNVSSSEHGSAIVIETEDKYNEISKFDLNLLDLKTDDYNNFHLTLSFAPEKFDGTDKDYKLLFNGQPATDVSVSAGKVTGRFIISFYDLDNVLVSVAVFDVTVEYYSSDTRVSLSLTNSLDSVSYLTNYANLNGAILQVVEAK